MTEQWRRAIEFPKYSISSHGRVKNEENDRLCTQFTNRQSVVYVSLWVDGRQYARSVRRLVAECFLEPPPSPVFDTPINIDGDLTNNHADNLMWRPRWFAMKYMRQFHEDIRGRDTLVRDIATQEVITCWDAAVRYGLLWREICWRAGTQLEHHKRVWPTGHIFELALLTYINQ